MESYFILNSSELSVDYERFGRRWASQLSGFHYPRRQVTDFNVGECTTTNNEGYAVWGKSSISILGATAHEEGCLCSTYLDIPDARLRVVEPCSDFQRLCATWDDKHNYNGSEAALKAFQHKYVVGFATDGGPNIVAQATHYPMVEATAQIKLSAHARDGATTILFVDMKSLRCLIHITYTTCKECLSRFTLKLQSAGFSLIQLLYKTHVLNP